MLIVVAEQRGGKLNRATWEAVAAARSLGDAVTVVVLGGGADAAAKEIAAADVTKIVIVDAPAVTDYTADGYVAALASLIGQQSPSLVLFSHTYQARDFVPALAIRLGRALVTDVTAINRAAGRTVYSRPVFQGKLSADVEAFGPTPHLVTLQIGAFRPDTAKRGASAPVKTTAVPVDASAIRQKPEAPFQEA